MAKTKFRAEVLTPEGEVFNDEVEMLSTRTVVGSIGILAKHAPLMAILDPTELRLYRSESEIVRFAQGEGYLQVAENIALVLVVHEKPGVRSAIAKKRKRRTCTSSRRPTSTSIMRSTRRSCRAISTTCSRR